MRPAVFISLCAACLVCCHVGAAFEKDRKNGTILWRAVVGEACQLGRLPRPYANQSRYVACEQPQEGSGSWSWKDKGIWIIKECPSGMEYDEVAMTCVPKSQLQIRQRSYSRSKLSLMISPNVFCPCSGMVCICSQPQVVQPIMSSTACYGISCTFQQQMQMQTFPIYQPMSCVNVPMMTYNVRIGQICNWIGAPLVPCYNNPSCYMQCMPSSSSCGTWMPTQCPYNMVFNIVTQLCVYQTTTISGYSSGPYGYQNPYIFRRSMSVNKDLSKSTADDQNTIVTCMADDVYGPCNANRECPGFATCVWVPSNATTAKDSRTITGLSGSQKHQVLAEVQNQSLGQFVCCHTSNPSYW